MGNLSGAEIRVVLRVRHNRRTTSATHFYQSVHYFRVSKQRYGCQCLGFLTCTQMSMPAIAHGGCTDNVRHSKLKVDSGSKNPLLHHGLEPESVLRLSFQSDAVPAELSPPLYTMA